MSRFGCERHERAIFFAALDRDDPAERAAYLLSACAGDPGLYRRVSDLLSSHEGAGQFLTTPAPEQIAGGAGEDLMATPGFLDPPGRPDSLGRLGGHEVLGVIGRGGTGVVLRAFDETLRRVVAIKVLAPGAAGRSARERFVREARAAAAVHHDNVVSIHAVNDRGFAPYLIMPLIEGPTLQDRVDRLGSLSIDETVRVGLETAQGLAAAHRQGLVHRDVKPANLLIEDASGRIKITDFGLARAVDDAMVTQAGVIAGTPAYMSPEQADGRRVDPRSDLFSLGSVLYFALTGVAPFGTGSTPTVLRRVCDHRPTPVATLNPDVPPWLADLVDRLHEKDPARRPESAEDVAALLRAGSAGATPSRRSRPRRYGLRAALCAGIVLTVALGAAEATGVTNLKGTVIRLLIPDGTLVVEVDDPSVSVAIEGTDLVITGAGAREIRLRPGDYRVVASRDGTPMSRELVRVDRDGRKIVRISKESVAEDGISAEDAAWEARAAALPVEAQVDAVVARLKQLNPSYDGQVTHTIHSGKVVEVKLCTDEVTDIRALRALKGLTSLNLAGTYPARGKLADLGPLRGLALASLNINSTRIADLGPLEGMPLRLLHCGETRVHDLAPLAGMPLNSFSAQRTAISDLAPLRGMPLETLDLYGAVGVSDLGPLEGMPLTYLNVSGSWVSDLRPIADAKQMVTLVVDDSRVSSLDSLAGMERLETLSIIGAPVVDLDALRALPLKRLRLTYRPADEAVLRTMTGLVELNEKPVADFWANRPAP